MNQAPVHISVVSPVYGAEGIVNELIQQLKSALDPITADYEILLIEDHSPDRSWEEIAAACEQDERVVGVKLSRNFGQHHALAAGLEMARGDFVVVCDCDLQHDPAYITQMYAAAQAGNDIVFTRTKTREHSWFKNLTAKVYYKILATLSDYDMDPNIGSFSILSRKVVDAYNSYNDYRKAYLWALGWVGFESTVIDIEHKQRFAGSSGYSLRRLIQHAVSVTLANSQKPLYLSVFVGILTSLGAIAGIATVIVRYFTIGGLDGWSSLIVVTMFFSGLILTSLGVIGIYLAMLFEQAKGRPRYIVSALLNGPTAKQRP